MAVYWGLRVEQRRQQLDLTQAQLAEQVQKSRPSFTQQTVSKIEAGDIVPRVGLMEDVAKGLFIEPWQLFKWPGQPEPEGSPLTSAPIATKRARMVGADA